MSAVKLEPKPKRPRQVEEDDADGADASDAAPEVAEDSQDARQDTAPRRSPVFRGLDPARNLGTNWNSRDINPRTGEPARFQLLSDDERAQPELATAAQMNERIRALAGRGRTLVVVFVTTEQVVHFATYDISQRYSKVRRINFAEADARDNEQSKRAVVEGNSIVRQYASGASKEVAIPDAEVSRAWLGETNADGVPFMYPGGYAAGRLRLPNPADRNRIANYAHLYKNDANMIIEYEYNLTRYPESYLSSPKLAGELRIDSHENTIQLLVKRYFRKQRLGTSDEDAQELFQSQPLRQKLRAVYTDAIKHNDFSPDYSRAIDDGSDPIAIEILLSEVTGREEDQQYYVDNYYYNPSLFGTASRVEAYFFHQFPFFIKETVIARPTQDDVVSQWLLLGFQNDVRRHTANTGEYTLLLQIGDELESYEAFVKRFTRINRKTFAEVKRETDESIFLL